MTVTYTINGTHYAKTFDSINEAESFIFEKQNEQGFELAFLHYEPGVFDPYYPLDFYKNFGKDAAAELV